MSENDEYQDNNRLILTIVQIIKAVMSSAADEELGALYINSREAIPQRHLLEKMGHPQPPTLIQVDKITSLGVINITIQPKANESNVHDISLAKMLGQSKTIQNLLESRIEKQRRLYHKISSSNSSYKHSFYLFNYNAETGRILKESRSSNI